MVPIASRTKGTHPTYMPHSCQPHCVVATGREPKSCWRDVSVSMKTRRSMDSLLST